MAQPARVTLWEVRSITGNSVTCVLVTSPRTASLSVFIGDAEIVVERFPVETEARRYAKGLYADFISQGCVDTSKHEPQ